MVSPERLRRLAWDFLEWAEEPPLHLGADDQRIIAAHFTEAAHRIESLEAALREPDRVARVIRSMAHWTPEMRFAMLREFRGRWCVGCGNPDPRCQCENDE